MEQRAHSYPQDKAMFIPISSPAANWEPPIQQSICVEGASPNIFCIYLQEKILFVPLPPPTCKMGAFTWSKSWLEGISFNIFCMYL